ncbi:hypothetical protein [Fundidesulfovibrio agrisoli]|uniref:hypothetical protein n=1 Tax=Fundidesulfovibrio agrisoli TaxID=2922717 RepID=UPI001FAD3B08|nr:hypothetical protein [Fundidesulfovibrio agrisoli]
MPRLMLAVLLLVFSPLAALGAEPAGADALTLARSVFKDAREDAPGVLTLALEKILRRPGVKDRTALQSGTRLTAFETADVLSDGRPYVLLFVEAEDAGTDVPGEGATVLALFRAGEIEPLDVVELKTDRFTSLSRPFMAFGGGQAFVVSNSHFNSNQGYQDAALFHIHKERIRRIASVFTLSLRGMCQRSFAENLKWSFPPDPGSPYPRVLAEVTLAKGPEPDDAAGCPKPNRAVPPAKFSDEYRWDKARDRFVLLRGGLGALEAFNRDKF